ncbi:MAG: peptidoglycan DD-metalloendopeptidase family protein [Chloroflexi bacterium]|nr:peptidoglycan DD-metalloendopeptidase family protein [Chloroflexota bacterium]
MPRPLRDRERGSRAGVTRRRLASIGIAATIAAAVIVGIASLGPGGSITPVGEVQGAAATGAPPSVASISGQVAGRARPSPAPIARGLTPLPTPKATPHPTPAPVQTLTGYQWPLPNGRLTLPFGPTPWGSRIVDGERFHDGLDLATFCGDRVVAAHAGTVLAAGRRYDAQMGWVGDLKPYLARLDEKGLYGTLPIVVVIDDGNGYRSIYAHFGKVVVKPGQVVRAGKLLGYEGATGRASGCHLHYGLFSPLETATIAIDPQVVKRMKVPGLEIARVDPLLVLPAQRKSPEAARPGPSPGRRSAGIGVR